MSVSLRRTTNTDQHKEPKCWFEELDQDTSRQDLRPRYDNATSSDFWSFLSLLICIAFVIGVGIRWLGMQTETIFGRMTRALLEVLTVKFLFNFPSSFISVE